MALSPLDNSLKTKNDNKSLVALSKTLEEKNQTPPLFLNSFNNLITVIQNFI